MNINISKYFKFILAPIFFLGANFMMQSQDTLDAHPYKDAEKLFNKFFPLAISLKYQKLQWNNSPNASINYEELDVWTPALGLEYNFFQTGQFNFKAGFFVRNMTRKTHIQIMAEDLGLNNDFNLIFEDSPYWTYHLPITIEYINTLSKGFALSLHAGYEIQYYGITEGEDTINKLAFYPDGVYTPVIVATEGELQQSLTTGANLGIGFYLEVGSTLMHLNVNYHYHFKSLIAANILATNLQVSPDARSNQLWTGHHFGFNLSFYPWRRTAYKVKNLTK